MRPRARAWSALAILLAAPATALAQGPHRPDLIVDQAELARDWTVGVRYSPPGDCTLEEGCILAPGWRKLLVFNVLVANLSGYGLELGDPETSPYFAYSPCHGHHHLLEFSDYALMDAGGGSLVTSRKQGWCLVDGSPCGSAPWVPAEPTHYDCSTQGLNPGWADEYTTGFECQWLDVTELPPGPYTLSAAVNSGRRIAELHYSNNASTAPVSIPDLAGDPDLVLAWNTTWSTIRITKRLFGPTDPDVWEGCVRGTGYRKVMTFDSQVVNLGTFDLPISDPNTSPEFVDEPSHGHTHLPDFAEFQIVDSVGNRIGPPTVQERWFPWDEARYLGDPWVPAGAFYFVPYNHGLLRGWTHTMPSGGSRQLVDLTEVPNGPYLLRSTINPLGALRESNLSNNAIEIPVTVAEPPGAIPHRPDGRPGSGQPLTVEPAAGGLWLRYDVTTCPASNYNVYSSLKAHSLYTYDAAVCDIGSSGDGVVSLPNPGPGQLLWFLIIGRAGGTEGGHGLDAAGRERPLSGVGHCGITESIPAPLCILPGEEAAAPAL
jgi:hypothetical protein